MSEYKRPFDGDATVVVKKDEIESRLESEEKTVLDTALPDGYKSIFDPELEKILKETEGYDFDEAPADTQSASDEADSDDTYAPAKERSAERVIRLQEEKREREKKKKLIIISVGVIALLAAVLVVLLLVKNGGEEKDYGLAMEKAQQYYSAGDYDSALTELRKAMEIKKEDECLLLMSRCYEAKYDYVNAIAILESSTSGDAQIKSEIERLKKAKEDYDSGKIVVICGEQYDVETTVLDLSSKGAGSAALRDVEKLTELTSLKLADNKITDIDFLKPLKKLGSLDLSHNEITDISALKELTALRTLHLDGNEITDFSPLYGLNGLSMLTITDMEIGQAQLKQLKESLPECIVYSDDAKEDIIDIKLGGKTFKSNVKELDLSGCGINDISALSVCTQLKTLDLSGNSITDISALVDIPGLTELDLSHNSINDISPLMSVTALEYLNISGNSVRSLAPIKELTGLRELNVSSNPLESISAVSGLNALKTLWMDKVGLTDAQLESLYTLKSLKNLSIKDNPELGENAVAALQKKLGGCKISHSELKSEIVLGGKSFAADAETVEAKELKITDISAAAGFKNVKHMDLSGNQISDVSALAGLTTLTTLDLSNNKLSDVSALAGLTGLKQLWLGGNELSTEDIDALKQALPECYISVE